MGRPHPDAPLQLVFRGECLDGHDPQAVRCAVAKALKLDEARASRLFSGKRVVLWRGVGEAAAHRQIARFAMMGGLLHAEPATVRPPSAAPAVSKSAATGRARDARRSPSRARIAALSVVTGLALALVIGLGLSTLAPEPQPHGAAAASQDGANLPPLATPGVTPAADLSTPAAAPAAHAAAEDEIPQDMTPAAVSERALSYLPAAGHKAFAISAGGAHAWHAGAASGNDASEQALAKCMAVRRPGDDGCRVVDLDGAWQE